MEDPTGYSEEDLRWDRKVTAIMMTASAVVYAAVCILLVWLGPKIVHLIIK